MVVERELAEPGSLAELPLELHTGQHLGVHRRREHFEAVLALPFGHVHREVRVAQQFVRRFHAGAGGADGDADAVPDGHARVVDRDPLLERRKGSLRDGHSGRGAGLVTAVEGDRELVTAEARHDLALRGGRTQSAGDDAQHLVTCSVAEGVVDDLEVVEVDEEDAEAPPARYGELVVHAFGEGLAVG